MMRFDLTCNIVLRVENGHSMHVHALPAVTAQQQLLHEVMWVEGCERWTGLVHPDGERVLALDGCESEVRIAFAASLTITPHWRDPAALRGQPVRGIVPPSAYLEPVEQWSAERIAKALGTALRAPAATLCALPEVFAWIRHCVERSDLSRYACAPMSLSREAADDPLQALHFAVAVFRALAVPARIVSGFAPDTPPLQAQDARAFYLELYEGGRWWLFGHDGRIPPFGCIRAAVGAEPSGLALVRGPVRAQPDRMTASVDPPPAWGLPLQTSSRLLLSLDGDEPRGSPFASDALAGLAIAPEAFASI